MSANPKPTGDREAPTSERRPSGRKRISNDTIRTLRYEFQVDAGEAYLEDISWRAFTNLKRRSAGRGGKSSPPPKPEGNDGGNSPAT